MRNLLKLKRSFNCHANFLKWSLNNHQKTLKFMHYRFLSEIPKEEYILIEQIGLGTFSDIFSATHLKTNSKVALKIFLKNNSQEYDKTIDQEVKINKSLHHPFICKFFTEFETDHLNVIVMELIEGQTLLDYVNQSHGLPPPEVSNFFAQLLIAIEYLHDEAHITHRDLKLENIMVDDSGHIRLIDFGFSTKNSLMSTLCGSIPYCAPEVLTGQLYTRASDIWSMGIILYALFDGNLPFFHHNTNVLVSMICNNELRIPDTFDGALKDLLIRMLDKDPEKRIKVDEIKQHPFVSHEKLLLIDYKQLFNPTEKPHEVIHTSMTTSQVIENNKLSENENVESKKRSGFLRFTNSMSNEAIEILHEKITLKTDDVDLSIENRRNFAHNLTKLIESAFYKHMCQMDSESGGTSLSHMIDNQLSLSSSQVLIQSNPLISLSLNHPGTSDNLGSFVNKNNRHYALTNHFAGLKSKKKLQKNNPKPPFPNPKNNLDKINGKPPPPPPPVNKQLTTQTPPLYNNQTENSSPPAPPVPTPLPPQINGKIALPKALQQSLHPLTSASSGPTMTDQSLMPQKKQQNFNVHSAILQKPGFSNPHFIAKAHRRHSHGRPLGIQTPIVSPFVAHNTINMSEE